MYEKELREELTQMCDDPDFAKGVLCCLDTDEQRKKVLDGVRSGELGNPGQVFDCVMETAGFPISYDNERKGRWVKDKESDQIWWLVDTGRIGEWVFSFDRVHKFYMFRDYPYKLTKEQKEIFDKENPYWADFFKDRVKEK